MNQSFSKASAAPSGSGVAPNASQKRYLLRGVSQPGGKLPLFEEDGRAVARQTVQSCIAHGWAEPWFANPLKPDWLVCRLTVSGYHVIGALPPPSAPATKS